MRPCIKGRKPNPELIRRDEFFAFADVPEDDLDFYWWAENWTAPFEGEVLKVKSLKGISYWETFSRSSIATLILILRYANSLFLGKLDPCYMLSHYQVNPFKNDIVFPLPIQKITEAALFSNDHIDDIEWLAELDDEDSGFEDIDDSWFLDEIVKRQGGRFEEDTDDFNAKLFISKLDKEEAKDDTCKAYLKKLGYYVESQRDLVKSLRIFQQSRKLNITGQVNDETFHRMEHELKQWRML